MKQYAIILIMLFVGVSAVSAQAQQYEQQFSSTNRIVETSSKPIEMESAYMRNSLPLVNIKANALYGALALAPNIGIEIGISNRFSLDLSFAINPWDKEESSDGKLTNHWIFKPELRYWTCERYNGHFFGIHPFYWKYNISGIDVPLMYQKDYRYDGNTYGGGVSYGYHWMLNKRWGIEFNIGAGVSFMNYDKYEKGLNAPYVSEFNNTYFGLTSIGVKLVYLIR